MMRILVTGAAGFIGSHLCERLLLRGDEVVGVDNFDPFYARDAKEQNLAVSREHPGFCFHELDLADPSAVEHLWTKQGNGLDAVVHLAAKAGVRPSIEDPLGYERANIQATMHLLERLAAASSRPKFVFASSSSVYGNNDRVPFSEEDSVDFPISPYAATKKACELLCHTYHHLYEIPTFCLRFFTVYGPRQRPDLAIHKFTRRILAGEPIEVFGDGTTSRDYTYIDDILDGVVASVDRCAGYEIINLGNSSPIKLSDLIAAIEQACGTQAEKLPRPMQPGDVERTYADITKAQRLLDFQPQTPLSAGLASFVQWYRKAQSA
jgi:UDP-glucuronate 4-epimerase